MYPEQVDSLAQFAASIGDILQQLDHFDDRRFVIMQVGLHQASLHIIVQRRQIIGDFTALLVVEAAFNPLSMMLIAFDSAVRGLYRRYPDSSGCVREAGR